jgi:integrase
MGLTLRKDGYYIEFPVLDDGERMTLARSVLGAKLKRWKTGTKNKTLAREQEACIKRDLMVGIIKSDRLSGPVTFKALAALYLDATENRRQATYGLKKSRIEQHLMPLFGGKVLEAITPRMAEEYREQRRNAPGYEGTTVKTATINREIGILKHMLTWAVRERLAKESTLKGFKLERENNARDRVLELSEFHLIAGKMVDDETKLVTEIAYHTAMREGEILNLERDQIDWKAGFIRLRAEDTKTDEARSIPLSLLPARILTALQERLKVAVLHDKRVFTVPNSTFRWRFNKAVSLAGIHDFRFHDLRHCATTNMRRAGIDAITIMKITGHKTLAMFKRYNSFHEKDLRAAAAQINTYLTRELNDAVAASANSLQSVANLP